MTSEFVGLSVVLCLVAAVAPVVGGPGIAQAQDSQRLQRARDLSAEVQQRIREGRYQEAIPKAREALAIREEVLGPTRPEVAQSLQTLAYLLLESGDYAGARPLYERALRILEQVLGPDHAQLAWPLTNLGRLLRQTGDYTAARAALERGLRIRERALGPTHPDVAHSLDNLGYLLQVMGDVAGARSSYERGLQIREQVFGPSHPAVASTLWSLAILLQRTGSFAEARPLYERALRIREQTQTVDPKALAKFADRLPAGTLAVQYFAAPDALYLFVVAPGGKFQVKSQAVSQKDLYALIREYRTQLDQVARERLSWADDGSEPYRRAVAPLKDTTTKLGAHLLGPIEAELAAHPNLVLFPNDLLLYLPIHALTRKDGDGTVRFLAETHVVSYVTQLELVDLLSPGKPAANGAVLAVANPDGTLPAASREVRELARIRPSVTTLEGQDATKARFVGLVSQFGDIHLATHGVLNPERPERSYLLLAGDDEASQRLTVGDIAGLSLAPNALAILSGCETALGEQVPGAALVTLAAAFSQAGSQSIVASLWKVSDAATRDFMVALHRALPAAGRASALQQAQLTVLRNPATAHPYYWAPFILIGAR